jgi:lipoprotein NlpD
MFGSSGRLNSILVLIVTAGLLAGCSSTALNRAPVEDRGSAGRSSPVMPDANTQAVKQPPGFENAGKAGYYTVKPGDTLIRIALDQGQSASDIARWSNVENPNRIEIGQVLRVVPPVATGVVTKPVTTASLSSVATPAASAASADKPPVAASSAPAASGEDDIAWMWPSNGTVVAGFDEVKNKGLDIGGAEGDPVVAAADGRVVYVGA